MVSNNRIFSAFFLCFEALMKNHQTNKENLSYCGMLLEQAAVRNSTPFLLPPPISSRLSISWCFHQGTEDLFCWKESAASHPPPCFFALREAFHSPTKSLCVWQKQANSPPAHLPAPQAATTAFAPDTAVVQLQHKSGVENSPEELKTKENKDIVIRPVSISRDGQRGRGNWRQSTRTASSSRAADY